MELLAISNIVLWGLVVALALTVLALARQIGVLNERVAPAGALTPTSGPKVGEQTEAIGVTALSGDAREVGGVGEFSVSTLVLFVSPTCPVCRSLVPTAMSMARAEKLSLVFASDGDTLVKHRAYADDLGIDASDYVLSETLGMHYGVSKLPFAVLIDQTGTLASKGLVNTREHLESLIEAMVTGVATLQEFVHNEPRLFDPHSDEAQVISEAAGAEGGKSR